MSIVHVARQKTEDGQDATPERIACAAERALEGARPLEHNGYKVPLAQNLVRRALTDLAT